MHINVEESVVPEVTASNENRQLNTCKGIQIAIIISIQLSLKCMKININYDLTHRKVVIACPKRSENQNSALERKTIWKKRRYIYIATMN